MIEFPAGLVGDEGEDDPAATAKKELEEETGFRCERVELLARGPSSAGITSEFVSSLPGLRRYGESGRGEAWAARNHRSRRTAQFYPAMAAANGRMKAFSST